MKDKDGHLQKKRKKIWIPIVVILVILIAAAAGAYGFVEYEKGLVYAVCNVEAGVTVSAADFLTGEDAEAYIVGYEDGFAATEPGQYELEIQTGLFAHPVTLNVQDTIAPELELTDMLIGYGEEPALEDFVTYLSDATEVELSYVNEPDFTACGEQTVEICAADLGGNQTIQTAQLTIWPLKQSLQIEAGDKFPGTAAFLLDESISGAAFVTDVSTIRMNHAGRYELTIAIDGSEYEVELVVADTQAPRLAVQDVSGYSIITRDASEFVTECTDATDVVLSYETEPDFTLIGEQQVVIVATDEGGNSTSAEATLTLEADTEAPVISGAHDVLVYLGNSLSYRSFLSATDNCEEGLSFTIDTRNVNLNSEGVYPVTCTATDAAGNTTTASFNVEVKIRVYTEEEVYALADAILARIITDDMSNYDKAYAIFRYVKSHMSYYSTGYHDSWIKAAGDSMTQGKGDCFYYASFSQALLTRAGITNMMIAKIPAKTNHYWNLVDIGDGHGWYHFDTTPRSVDNQNFFLWTDAQLMEYSAAHNNSHNYDKSAYPVIP